MVLRSDQRALVSYENELRAPADRRGGAREQTRSCTTHTRRSFTKAATRCLNHAGLRCGLVPARKAHYAIALVLVSAAALAVSATSSPTRGDLVFGMGAWLLFVAFTTACGSVVLGLTVGVRRLLRRRIVRDSGIAIATMLIAAAAAFPISAEWDDGGHRASGLVPAAQALLMPIWPESAWQGRPQAPLISYAYSCCG